MMEFKILPEDIKLYIYKLYMDRHVLPFIKNIKDNLIDEIKNICITNNYTIELCYEFIEIVTDIHIIIVSWTIDFGFLFEIYDKRYNFIKSISKNSYINLMIFVKNNLLFNIYNNIN